MVGRESVREEYDAMNALQKRLIKGYLTPEIECDLPGRLRLGFRKYNLLPPEALPYLHYVKDALDMPGGVIDVQLNARIGTALILYDPSVTSSRQIMKWIGIVTDVGLELAGEQNWQPCDEGRIAQLMRNRLKGYLPIN